MSTPSTPKLQSNAVITAIGSYVPERILSNADLEQLVETSDEWIIQRTGIRERRIAREDEYCSDLCFAAVRNMMDRYGASVQDVDYIVVATSTPDTVFPSMAARVQGEFGIENCGTMDVQAACAGFSAALQVANGLMLTGVYRKILVIGAETLSKITDYTDRTTCILFGDGAGAVLVEPVPHGDQGAFLASYSKTEGAGGHQLYRSSLSSSIGPHEIASTGTIVQNGREVYRWAVSQIPEGVGQLLHNAGMSASDIDWFIPHSANQRILDSVCERTGIPTDQTLSSIEYYGNTSAASIPLALDLAVQAGRVQGGDLLLLYGFGGGLTQAGLILRWSI
ncbi:ketoacyl-ACP synthase III [Paenibacillus sp. GCM10023252]|uniref:ketoacyl-ACP synthase III n=1 Tax=Paenibacillus sp. GCM10023252 TaxID=3252649 RepID=UPI003618AC6E